MEQTLLRQLRAHRPKAMEQVLMQYSAYVYTVVRGRACGLLPPEDLEEIVSDVFLALWAHPERVTPGKLRSWLGAAARNKTIDRLRRHTPNLSVEEDAIELDDTLWMELAERERAAMVREAVSTLCPQDRELFVRYYELGQSTAEIAHQMNLSRAAVKTRLHRGRKQLKDFFAERGFTDEAEI